MLKNRYQEIIVGLGIMPLVRGIISQRRHSSTLLIDDYHFKVDTYSGDFLSELEVLSFMRLSRKYDIPELAELRQFLVPATLQLISSEKRLSLGRSPLENIKEVLRKFPEFLDPSEYDQVYSEKEGEFNQFFLDELIRFEKGVHESCFRTRANRFELNGPRWFKIFFKNFKDLLNQEYHELKTLKFQSLLHLLGIFHEGKLKKSLGVGEILFYFFRTFSPVYRLQDFFLGIQLKRRFSSIGGDYKESTIQHWQLYENKFENLLLASFEGVISGERVLFFSEFPEGALFQVSAPYPLFRKAQLSPVKRPSSPLSPTQITLFVDTHHLGSENPYRALISGRDFSYYHWPYPEIPGSKPDFYKDDLMLCFNRDRALLPLPRHSVEVSSTSSMILDMRSFQIDTKFEEPILDPLPLEIRNFESKIKGLEYWGGFKYRSLGNLALTYGIEAP